VLPIGGVKEKVLAALRVYREPRILAILFMGFSSGLPLGLQITADHGQDARVIRTAVQLHRMLGSRA